jgi:hypothetical protein
VSDSPKIQVILLQSALDLILDFGRRRSKSGKKNN